MSLGRKKNEEVTIKLLGDRIIIFGRKLTIRCIHHNEIV